MSSPSTINDPQSTIRDRTSDPEVLVRVNGVSKKFCRDLKKSLWYGVKDVASELLPFGKRAERREQGDARGEEEALNITERSSTSSSHPLTFRDSCLHAPALRPGEFWANKDISFELKRGECIGLIGHNGAGKTTLLKMLNGLIKPDEGFIEMRGRVGALIALGAGFNPILTGRENIYVNGSILGLTKNEIDAKINDIIDFAEIPDFIDAPVQTYSSGMQVRLGFAVATALNPDILIVDEVLAVGDFRFRWKCLQRIKELRLSGVSIILVSHQAADLMRTCDRGVLLNKGTAQYVGTIQETLHHYERERASAEPDQEIKRSLKSAQIEDIILSVNSDNTPNLFTVDVIISAIEPLDKIRLVIGFFHSHCGSLFHISSYHENGWIYLVPGKNRFEIQISGFSLQSGTCSVEVSLRGENIGDIYDIKQSKNQFHIMEPSPTYEGFGINGVIAPNITWNIN